VVWQREQVVPESDGVLVGVLDGQERGPLGLGVRARTNGTKKMLTSYGQQGGKSHRDFLPGQVHEGVHRHGGGFRSQGEHTVTRNTNASPFEKPKLNQDR
jgi:hypothetical protein